MYCFGGSSQANGKQQRSESGHDGVNKYTQYTVIYLLACLHGRRLSRRRRRRSRFCYRRRQRTISRNILNLITAFHKNRNM